MTRIEHLLWLLAEECAEVAQRASKAARFGLGEVQPGQDLTNARRIVQELDDLLATVVMLEDEGCLPSSGGEEASLAKRAKVEEFLRYSAECGTLEG